MTSTNRFSFERVANLADGTTAKVAFDLTILKDPLSPQIGYFTCHNRYPENFWKPEFQSHANGAQRIGAAYLLARDPSDHHEFLGGVTGQRSMRATSLGLELETPRGRIVVLNPGAYGTLVGPQARQAVRGELPQIAALEIICDGLDARRVVTGDALFGLTLVLTPAS